MLFRLKDSERAKATIITGLIGTILGAVGIINYFQVFLNLLGYCFMPVAGVMIADYWIRLKGKSENGILKKVIIL
jgi:cytosine permease